MSVINHRANSALIVLEDDHSLREEILLPGLSDYGFEVTGAGTAGTLYRVMMARRFDLAVLDINLPDESGLSVVRHLRELLPELGIVMLTANTLREDRIEALNSGVDAYLSKPVDIEELALVLRNLQRRLSEKTSRALPQSPQSGQWHLQSDGWCLASPNGRILALTASERCVLRRLDQEHGHAVSRETLIATLVEDTSEFDPHRLEMLIHRLRKKAGSITGNERALPLLSSRGAGYLWAD